MLRFAPLLLLLGCVTTPKGAVGRCPDSLQTACLTREICSYDAAGNCNRCRCDDPYLPANRPSDPNQPPFQPSH